MNTKQDRIQELVSKINQARNDYYNGQSNISDKVFDAWIDELSELDPKNLAVIGIGAEPTSEWKKYAHKVEMGSLNKAQTEEEYRKWHAKYIGKDDSCLFTVKLDGLSVSLVYENGVLVTGATRGSGRAGDEITTNIARMNGVPLRLPNKDSITVRGEIVLSKKNHEKYFKDFSNARNGASGASRRLDGEGCDKLDVLVYQVHHDTIEFKTYEDQFNYLLKTGFGVPAYAILKTADEVIEWKNKYHSLEREKYEFDLDGLVIHLNDLNKYSEYGVHNGKPYASIAYKFDSVSKEATISKIEIQAGNSGRQTPVAYFDPKVELMGAMIEKATLHNFGNIQELGIGVGAKVLVCRSGDVIPFIEEVIEAPKEIFPTPTQCASCSARVVTVGEYIQCINFNCPAQMSGRIKNWVSELNILELGEKLIDKLVESGLVKDVSDLYTLTVEKLSSLERMGEKSANNVYNSLWKINPVSLDALLGGLSIPMIGSSTIRLIMDAGFDSLEKIQAITLEQISNIKGIGPVKAASLHKGLQDYKNVISQLLNNGLKIKEKIQGSLTGMKIAITGSTKLKRAVLEQMISDHGGENKSSVGKSCSHLIISDPNSNSSKAVKARDMGIKLISEDQFLAMIK